MSIQNFRSVSARGATAPRSAWSVRTTGCRCHVEGLDGLGAGLYCCSTWRCTPGPLQGAGRRCVAPVFRCELDHLDSALAGCSGWSSWSRSMKLIVRLHLDRAHGHHLRLRQRLVAVRRIVLHMTVDSLTKSATSSSPLARRLRRRGTGDRRSTDRGLNPGESHGRPGHAVLPRSWTAALRRVRERVRSTTAMVIWVMPSSWSIALCVVFVAVSGIRWTMSSATPPDPLPTRLCLLPAVFVGFVVGVV